MIAFAEPRPLNGIERGFGDVKGKPWFFAFVSPRHLRVVSIDETRAIGETICRARRNLSRIKRVRLPKEPMSFASDAGNGFEEVEENSRSPIESRVDRFRFAGVRIVCHNESERSSIVVHAFQRHAGRSHRKRRAFGDLDGLGINIEGACLITGVGRKIRSEPNSRARSGLRAGRPFFGDYRS